MNGHHGVVVAVLLALVSGLVFVRSGSAPGVVQEIESPHEKFGDSVRRFVTLYNRRHNYAYKFTYPYFELKFTRPAALDVLRDTQYAKAFGTNRRDFHPKALDHAKEKVNLLRPFRAETTKYEILELDPKSWTRGVCGLWSWNQRQ